MKIRILGLAVEDFEAGREFTSASNRRLGVYFLETLFSDIETLLLHAGVHVNVFGYFRALSKRFPYAIYYKVNGEGIEVWRVLDCRQNPRRTAKALLR